MAVEATEGVSREAIVQALSEAVKRTGWKVSERAGTTIVAIIGRGETRQLEYRSGPRRGAGGNVQTASITPFTARLEIRQGNQVCPVI